MKDKSEQILSRNINIFLVGYLLYSFAFVLTRTNPSYLIYIANELLCFLGLAMVTFSLMASIRMKNSVNGYVKVIVALLIIWFYVLVAWSLPFEFDFIKAKLFIGESSLMAYFVPLVVFIPNKLKFIKKAMTGVVVLGVVYLLFLLLFKDVIFKFYGNSVENSRYVFEFCAKWLSLCVGFLILTFSYQSKKIKIFAIVLVLAMLLVAIFRARRAIMFMSLVPVLMAAIIYIAESRYKLLAIITSVFIGIGVFFFAIQAYESNQSGLFGNLESRIDQDSRSGVEDCFINDFTFTDWIVGRGFTGRYFCPNVDENNEVSGYRTMIETDYLMIILKNGSIYLAMLLLVLIPAVFKGIFRSQNILSKAAGCWILFWIICLYPANVFGFSMNYLLVWLSVGICYSKEIRNIPDAVLKEYFLNNENIDSVP